jgi:HlyD family secretion protein
LQLKKRHLAYGIAIVLVLVITILALLPDPIPVETAKVERGPMSVTVESRGETRVRDRFVITAPISGRVARIGLREGEQIDRGDVVARITPLPMDSRQRSGAEARVSAAAALARQAAAAVQTAEAAWQLARRERSRVETLAREGVSAEQALDQARTEEELAQRELQAARQRAQAASSDLEAARAALISAPVEVRSPVSGRLFRIPERSERIVNAGTPILEIGDAALLELVIDVLSQDAVKISAGDRVIVEQWGGDRPLHGTVRLVEPSAFEKISALGIEEQRVNVIADIADAPPELGDAYRVEAKIVVWESDNVLKVPVSALARAGDEWSVFVVKDDRAVRRVIEVGHRNALEAEVLKGLLPGELVIEHPSFEIREGVRVEG